MNKLKEASQALKAHLGRDKAAVELLDRLMIVANEQRVKVASIEKMLSESKLLADELRKQRDEYANERDSIKAELFRNMQMRENAERNLAKLLSNNAEDSKECETGKSKSRGENIVNLMKFLCKKYKKMPNRDGECAIYVEDYIQRFSYDEYAKLGMVASCVAMVFENAKIHCETILRDTKVEVPENVLARFVHWMRDTIKKDPVQDKILSSMEDERNIGKRPQAIATQAGLSVPWTR